MRKLAGLICLLLAGASQAATVVECGPNVCYEYDDAQVAAGTDYFRLPTLIGDDMRFLPISYKAQSVDGVGDNTGTNTDVYGTTFVFDRIYSLSGADILDITVVEKGDYLITGGDSIEANLLMLAANNNNAAECECDADSFLTSTPTGLTLWEMSTSLSPFSLFSSPANDVALSLQNTLSATTDSAGETAWIQKKFVSVSVTVVPVPAAVWLFASALGMLLTHRRKPYK